jgi:hypothetical protein
MNYCVANDNVKVEDLKSEIFIIYLIFNSLLETMNSVLIDLFRSIKQNNIDQFKSIISSNLININQYLYGATPLFYCIECKNQIFALELLRNPTIDQFLKSNLEVSCLEKAMENKLFEVVQVLLKKYNRAEISKILENFDETILTKSIKNFDQMCAIMLIEGNSTIRMQHRIIIIFLNFS